MLPAYSHTMKWDNIDQQHCSVARSLAEIGDRWTLLIIRDAVMGARRFEDFVERSGAARNIVTDRINKLCDAKILQAQVYQQKPDRYEYRLTEKGTDLYPVLLALLGWGDKWHLDADKVPMQLSHSACGHPTHAVPVCNECREELKYGSTVAALRDPTRPYWQTG